MNYKECKKTVKNINSRMQHFNKIVVDMKSELYSSDSDCSFDFDEDCNAEGKVLRSTSRDPILVC